MSWARRGRIGADAAGVPVLATPTGGCALRYFQRLENRARKLPNPGRNEGSTSRHWKIGRAYAGERRAEAIAIVGLMVSIECFSVPGMFTVFTCCANNYLAHAKTLGDSVLDNNPDARFVIMVVDKLDDECRQFDLSRFDVIEIENVTIPEFESMTGRYHVYELSVAVKPFAFEHLLAKYPDESIIFLDPDILVTGNFASTLEQLKQYNLVLTPHGLTPIDDDCEPKEQVLFKYGTYNAGFVALKPSDEINRFLAWWKKRLVRGAFADVQKGFFGDQFWLNMAPLYFKGVYICRDWGFNVAVWNLHERVLSQQDGRYYVNGETPLTFFHFSSIDFSQPDQIARGTTRFDLTTRTDLRPIYEEYRKRIFENGYERVIGKACAYQPKRRIRAMRALVSLGYGLQPYLPVGFRIATRKAVDRASGSRLF